MHYVYIIQSLRNSKRYIGVTSDLKRRLAQHNKGLVKYTKWSEPFKLMHCEEFSDRKLAMKRERFFKTGKGREVLENLLKGPATEALAGHDLRNDQR